MRLVILVLTTALLGSTAVIPAMAGPCTHSWQTASDGSSCGGRSADSRPGGEGSQ
jgi:hypothetical protein